MRHLLIILNLFFVSLTAIAGPNTFSFNGYFTNLGTPVSGSIPYQLDIKALPSNCIVYTETGNVTVTTGNFSINVGSGGTQNLYTKAKLSDAFNSLSGSIAGNACSAVGTTSWIMSINMNAISLGDVPLNSVPYAMWAERAESASLAANFTGALVGDVNGTQTATQVDKIKGYPLSITAPANGHVLTYSGGNWINQVVGTVTNITTGSGLSGGPITNSGTISLANIADGTVLANVTGSSNPPSSTTISALLDKVTSTHGSLLYRNATNWTSLSPGTPGHFLQTQGGSANPIWAAAGGAGDITDVVAGTGLTGGASSGSATLSVDVGTGIGQIQKNGAVLGNNAIVMTNPSGLLSTTSCSTGEILKATVGGWSCQVDNAGGGSPGGINSQIQFNNAGAFDGSANFVWDNTNSRLGIGTTPSVPLHASGTILVSNTNKSVALFQSDIAANPGTPAEMNYAVNAIAKPTAAVNYFSALHGTVDYSASSGAHGAAISGEALVTGSQNPSGVMTYYGHIDQSSSTALPGATGANIDIKTSGSGVITQAKGIDLKIGGTGTISNAYGIYISSMDATNKYAIYSTDATVKSYFAGNVGVGAGALNPAYKLDVDGDINVTGNFRVNGTPIGGGLAGTGTTDKIPKFTSTSTIGDSIISETGGGIDVAGGYYAGGFQVLTSSGYATHKGWLPAATTSPGPTTASQGSLYFDSTKQRFMASENTGSYNPISTSDPFGRVIKVFAVGNGNWEAQGVSAPNPLSNFGVSAAVNNTSYSAGVLAYSSGNCSGFFYGSTSPATRLDWKPVIDAALSFNATIPPGITWVGLQDNALAGFCTGASNGIINPTTANVVGFMHPGGTLQNWKCVACNSSACTPLDSGITGAASTAYHFRIDGRSPTPKFFINDAEVCQSGLANVPPSSANLGFVMTTSNSSGTFNGIFIHNFVIQTR